MSQGLVERQYLEDIGDAIRSKVGGSSTYTPSRMASAIAGIHTADEVVLVQKTVNANGQYNASDDSADGYSGVRVNVPNTYSSSDDGKVVSGGALVSQSEMSVVSNGTYDTTLFSQVSVAIHEAVLMSKVISENGTYNAADDGADGFSQVTVNVAGGGGDDNAVLDVIFGYTSGSIYHSSVIQIPNRMFKENSALTGVSFPECMIITDGEFSGCTNLSVISFPKCTSIAMSAFTKCTNLRFASFPECTYINNSAFYSCKEMSFAFFLKCSYIGTNAFRDCFNLLSLYMLNSSVATLRTTGVFLSTPISTYTVSTGGVQGSIFVPASLVESYKNANNWSVYAERITAYIEE